MSTTINATSPAQDVIVTAGNNAAATDIRRTAPADENTPTMPNRLSVKDDRAYERERQRVKKVEDLAKMRARKAQGSWSERWYGSGRRVPTSSRRALTRSTVLDGGVYDGVLPDLGSGAIKHDKPVLSPSSVGEINLSDLITTKRTTKTRKHAGAFVPLFYIIVVLTLIHLWLDSEFELVPHVRSVIALDDITTHDFTVNEPWEHVDLDDFNESKATPVSYANVLAGSK